MASLRRLVTRCWSPTPRWVVSRATRGVLGAPVLPVRERRKTAHSKGVLPLYHSRSPLTGSHISSLEGGILAEPAEAIRVLVQEALRLRDELSAGYLQLRGGAARSATDRGQDGPYGDPDPDETPMNCGRALRARLAGAYVRPRRIPDNRERPGAKGIGGILPGLRGSYARSRHARL